MDPQFYLESEDEKARYDLHQNSAQDAGFLKFLRPFIDFVASQVQPPAKLLDFGSGPEPVLAESFRQRGFEVQTFDPLYSPDQKIWSERFDAIYMHEVIEHLKDPLPELRNLQKILKPRGQIFIRSSLHEGPEFFKTWYYPKDSTHICFFSRETEIYLKRQFPLRFY